MKISRSTGYALLAVNYLAKNQKDKIILYQTISKKYDIPLEYLLKIMQQLVKVNILRSKRGPRGGFSLVRTPNKITLLEIIEAVEGPMINQLDMTDLAKGEKFAVKTDRAYNKAISAAKAVFQKTKFSELIS